MLESALRGNESNVDHKISIRSSDRIVKSSFVVTFCFYELHDQH